MKEYDPEKMISDSRFSVLFADSDKAMQEKVLSRIDRLVSDNRPYADDKNYCFLCNLFTSLAFVFSYEERGRTREESIAIVRNAMYDFVKPQINTMKKLSRLPVFVPFLKVYMPIKIRKTAGYGWNIELPQAPNNTFSMITHDCIFDQLFRKYGIPELTAVFCHIDDIIYDALPGADFVYTQQIGNGGSCCDYSFVRK